LQWQLALPDGQVWGGPLAAGLAGQTVSIDDLKNAWGWGLVQGGYQNPITVVTPSTRLQTAAPAGAGSAVFSNIPQTYRHLTLRGQISALSAAIKLFFNTDTTLANYGMDGADACTSRSNAGFQGTVYNVGNFGAGILLDDGWHLAPLVFEVQIPWYTAFNGLCYGRLALKYADGSILASTWSGLWNAPAAVTQLQLVSAGLTGTIDLYGVS